MVNKLGRDRQQIESYQINMVQSLYYIVLYSCKYLIISIKQTSCSMSFKASIDILVNFSYIQVRFLNRQGYLRYRMKIYMKYKQQQAFCHPYNIVRGPSAQLKSSALNCNKQYNNDSQIDSDTGFYYSRLIPVQFRPGKYQENQTVFFKAMIQTQIIEEAQFYCIIQCLFSQSIQQNMEVVGKFEAKIRKINDVSTFLPVVFDVFQGFMIFSTFHSTFIQFKYSQDDFQTLKVSFKRKTSLDHYDFYSYLKEVTSKFDRSKLLQFYTHYRSLLQHEHQSLQSRHQQIVNKLQKQKEHQKDVRLYLLNNNISYAEIFKNFQILQLISGKQQKSNISNNKSKVIQLDFQSKQRDCSIVHPVSPQESQIIAELILKDFSGMKSYLYKKWMELAQIIVNFSKPVAKLYRKQYQLLCKQRFKNNVFSHRIKNHDWKIAKYGDSGKINLEQAFKQKRKMSSEEQLWRQYFPIQNTSYFGKCETSVKMFQQVYLTNSKKSQQFDKKLRHIVVLVHGFQASRQDFILIKNCLQVVYGIQVVISTCNQGMTQSSIVIAGKRLANQIKNILSAQNNCDFKLSFLGHSMGGLIIRSAIPDIQHLKQRFYTFMSFSSPHLGYLYQSSALIKAGLWLLTSLNKIDALQELTMKDQPNLRQTTLYKLSNNNSLKHFKRLCFVCSSLDEYVPYESARIQQNQQLMQETMNKETQIVIRQMVEGMIGQIDAPEISRINVIFNISARNLDSFLGRTGHVKFLSDIQFIREFCSCFDKFFI